MLQLIRERLGAAAHQHAVDQADRALQEILAMEEVRGEAALMHWFVFFLCVLSAGTCSKEQEGVQDQELRKRARASSLFVCISVAEV